MRIHPAWKFRPEDHFLVSYPRSGNTWLRHLLAEVLTQGSPGVPAPENLEQIIPTVHKAPAGELDAKRWGGRSRIFKSHNISGILPARLVYIVRDPVDAIVSFHHQRVKNAELKGTSLFHGCIADFCCYEAKRWRQHVQAAVAYAQLKPDDILIIAFERLVDMPRETLASVASFLNVNATGEQLQIAVDRCSIENLRAREIRRKPLIAEKEFFRKGRVGGGREEVSQVTLAQIDAITKPTHKLALRTIAGRPPHR